MSDEASGASGTVCPFCGVGCRLDRDGDRTRGRTGPANPDGRLCEKGIRAYEATDDGDRLTAPLVRDDRGELQTASWDVAIHRVVAAFEGVVADYGPDALAFLGAPRCTNEENYLLQKLARSLGTNNVDNRARVCHAEVARALEARFGRPAGTNGLDDLGEADVFLVVGANPAARQPVAFDRAVRPAVNDGATLVHVDPHRNETTRVADRHVAPRPGTDAAVVAAVCALVAEAGDVDEAFVRDRTTGYDEFRAWLDGVDVSAAARAADVDPADLREIAAAVGEAERVAVLTGTGADEPDTAHALLDLLLLTGNVARPGTGVHVLRGLNNEQGAVDAGSAPDRLPGHEPVEDPASRERVADVWGFSPPPTPGRTERDLVAAFGDEVRGALVVGENPAVSKRDPDWLARRLDSLDVLVVNELFPSETTEHADVVLPAAAGVEKAGTVTNLDRTVQRLRPLADPPGEARVDFDVLAELGRRLVGEGFDYAGPPEAFAELTSVAPPYAALSYDDLAERGRRWPAPVSGDGPGRGRDGTASGDGVLYADAFDTDDGRAPFVRVAVPTAPPADGDSLRLVVGDRAGGFVPDERALATDGLTVHPADAAARDLSDGDRVVVSNDAATVETTARVDESVRPGTVYLHASMGDPLVRGGDATVRVRRAEAGSGS